VHRSATWCIIEWRSFEFSFLTIKLERLKKACVDTGWTSCARAQITALATVVSPVQVGGIVVNIRSSIEASHKIAQITKQKPPNPMRVYLIEL
jgi:hypothetical protein